MTALLIRPEEKEKLKQLVAYAAANPIDMSQLMEKLKNPEGKEAHMQQMTRQSVSLPEAYVVTFSIEENHPCGTCRHMSMTVQKPGRVPNEQAVWMVAEELGFWGTLQHCQGIWLEELVQGKAVNVVQPMQPAAVH